jgi:hypothetical protein
MAIPSNDIVVDGHFVESVQFDLKNKSINNYFKNMCSRCEKGQEISQYDPVENSLLLKHKYPRSEIASYRLLQQHDIKISWKIRLNSLAKNVNSTVSQVIGWQKDCFGGGNYHIRSNNGNWQVWMRNLGENTRDIILNKPIKYDEWTEIAIFSNFDDTNGYFTLAIKDSSSFNVFELIEGGPSFVSCELGPYLKFGGYTSHKSNLNVEVKDIKVTYR